MAATALMLASHMATTQSSSCSSLTVMSPLTHRLKGGWNGTHAGLPEWPRTQSSSCSSLTVMSPLTHRLKMVGRHSFGFPRMATMQSSSCSSLAVMSPLTHKLKMVGQHSSWLPRMVTMQSSHCSRTMSPLTPRNWLPSVHNGKKSSIRSSIGRMLLSPFRPFREVGSKQSRTL
jgi:hypothetical protein